MALIAILSPLKNWSTIFCSVLRLTASSASIEAPSASRALRTPSRKESIFWISPLTNGKQALRSKVWIRRKSSPISRGRRVIARCIHVKDTLPAHSEFFSSPSVAMSSECARIVLNDVARRL